MQRQQAIEAERQRTLEIQAEVERQVALKQRALADKEARVNQEDRALAKERSMLEQTSQHYQRKAKEIVQALVETERQQRAAAETERAVLQGILHLLTALLHQKLKVSKMDLEDKPVEVPIGHSTK